MSSDNVPPPTSVRRVGVCGSGIMGSGLAEVIAKSGFDTVVRSRSLSSAQAMLDALERSLDRQVDKGKLSETDRKETLRRIEITDRLSDLSECDLVVESVVEDLAVKKELLAELGAVVADHAILATNTSTLPIVELAMASGRPDRVCGIHFFNPAPVMALVELAKPITASDETMSTAREFVVACGKSPVDVEDRAGFVVNALLFPYLNSAVRLLEHGTASMADIDIAMKGGCNFPMGPFALLDLVGLDTSVAILEALYAEYRDPNYAPVPTLRRLVAAGRLGRKSGRGFYEYRS
jgi:3-hydroxybutyryl-CoA dehydrogenase